MSGFRKEEDETGEFDEIIKDSFLRSIGIEEYELKEMAVTLKAFYDSFISAGFSEGQALDIVIGIVVGKSKDD